jgi:hypothetical protein
VNDEQEKWFMTIETLKKRLQQLEEDYLLSPLARRTWVRAL